MYHTKQSLIRFLVLIHGHHVSELQIPKKKKNVSELQQIDTNLVGLNLFIYFFDEKDS